MENADGVGVTSDGSVGAAAGTDASPSAVLSAPCLFASRASNAAVMVASTLGASEGSLLNGQQPTLPRNSKATTTPEVAIGTTCLSILAVSTTDRL